LQRLGECRRLDYTSKKNPPESNVMKIEIIKRQDKPLAEYFCYSSSTPETDENVSVGLENADRECVPVEFARKLKRERDEARELLASEKITRNHIIEKGGAIEKERDEAREKVKELIYIAERAIDLAEIDFENDKFGVVSELRDGLEKIKEETK
jgi:hypothetical protein